MTYAIKHNHITAGLEDEQQLPGWTLENGDEIMDGWTVPGDTLTPPATPGTLYPSLHDVLDNQRGGLGKKPVRVYRPIALYAEGVPVELTGFELAGLWLPMTGGQNGK